jgi:3-oxoacyl-[acyl-carrier-protein] synthase-1
MNKLQLTHYTLTSAIGVGIEQTLNALKQQRSGLAPCEFEDVKNLQTFTGVVAGVDEIALPRRLQHFTCRNNQLAEYGLLQDGFIDAVEQARQRYGASRVAVILGTSTSGIRHTEKAYAECDLTADKPVLPDWYQYEYSQNVFSLASYVKQRLGLEGIAELVSTACSSSAKVFATASRMIELGLCDAAVVGGVDSLCLTTLYGFNALQVVSPEICKPSDQHRQGLSLGEAAGFALVEKDQGVGKVCVLGYGESSDAYHMSSPSPEGDGAYAAMQDALTRANLKPDAVDYVNLHGTGTQANDLAESKAVCRLFGQVPASSTKGYTGHTLGAAGIAETVISSLAIEHGFLPHSLNTEQVADDIAANILLKPQEQKVSTVLTNSFGFGGSNCSLILGVEA